MEISVAALWHEHRWWMLPLVLLLVYAIRHRNNAGSRWSRLDEPTEFDDAKSVTRQALEKSWQKWEQEKKNIPHAHSVLPAGSIRKPPKRITGTKKSKLLQSKGAKPQARQDEKIQPLVFFTSLSGSTERFAASAIDRLKSNLEQSSGGVESNILTPQLLDLSYIEYDDYFTSLPKLEEPTAYFYIILLPTYNIDTVITNFLEHLQETHHDFRIDTSPLRNISGYGVFGFGDKEGWPTEETGFCSQAREVDAWMAKLTNKRRAYPVGMGDVKSDAEERLNDWFNGISSALCDLALGRGLGEGVPGSGEALESDEEDELDDEDTTGTDASGKTTKRPKIKIKEAGLSDLESIGLAIAESKSNRSTAPVAVDFTTKGAGTGVQVRDQQSTLKPMVPETSPTYTSLTKQGYSIIGTHSGVKICRWTKSALRGRGSCYKYSFYGIQSHLCMETTPSLSCSNKCVFCWRHGTNPVGTTWRWQVDPPDLIFNGAKEAHYKKIKMMRGVPGVRAERFEEAMRIRHCALSLVGEPIFYPHINAFLGMLHAERISSFLVCNAQHPAQLAALDRVTQLYVSIDASNRESLRRIDRPLHRDFWERFNACLDILAEKRFMQRTVFRLTLVKGFNLEDEAQGYADLVAKGLPCFVEVKGVTYCGTATSAGAGLTMQNVPFYEEVCAFVEALNAALAERGLEYGIAAEHAHSCCILLASNRFYINDKWHTTIEYSRFFKLLEAGAEFTPEDYCSETPDWALWGNGGFDPRDERVDRKGRKKVVELPSNTHRSTLA